MIDNDSPLFRPPPPAGRIDIHSHLLPGIDDGCQDMAESLACIRRLKAAGYVGSICTPHLGRWQPELTPQQVMNQTIVLQSQLRQLAEDYRIWPGGEVGLWDGVIAWMQAHGVPTLAGSRCVLVDMWPEKWEKWINPAFRWLIDQGYQPILAHPERSPCVNELDQRVRDLEAMGVWLQGNLRCITGEDGYAADLFMRQWLAENRYRFLALDMHRPDSLVSRLEGIGLVEQTCGRGVTEHLIDMAPRRDIF